MVKNNITVRNLKLTDNLETVAELIYQTDHPYWFENYKNWKDVLVKLIKSKGSLFYYKNIIVAIDDDNIVGIVVAIDEKNALNYDYSTLIKINKNFEYTIKNYIIPTSSYINNNTYISNVCVSENARNRGIGYQLINFVKDKYKNDISLDCLANNKGALNLYYKCSFKIVERTKGFSDPNSKNPEVVKLLFERNLT